MTENLRSVKKIALFSKEEIVLTKSKTMFYISKEKLKELKINLLNRNYT